MKKIAFHLLFFIIGINAFSSEYWVFFKNKKGVTFDPYTFFDEKAIKRREKHNLSLYDSTDFPINKTYIEKIIDKKTLLLGQSRWLNAIKIDVSSKNIKKIQKFPFVKEVVKSKLMAKKNNGRKTLPKNQIKIANTQLHLLGNKILKEKGLDGETVRIAVFDGGFPNVEKDKRFSHLFKNKKIVAQYNFIKRNTDVYRYNEHGTSVLACLAAKDDSLSYGLATGAEYLLAITEENKEVFSEEENWLMAAEWADRLGADIINSSVGYTKPRYKTFQMDGKTSLVARAANLAAQKGILIVVAAGNEGQRRWKTLATPADAKNVLTVGSIHPITKTHLNFSSCGPSTDGRSKPDVCASGIVLTIGANKTKVMMGTSFSAPLVAGLVACLLQDSPNLQVNEILERVKKSSSLYPYFDYAHGYGIPHASLLFPSRVKKETQKKLLQISRQKDGSFLVKVPSTYIKNNEKNKTLYYHTANKNNILINYGYKTIKKDDNQLIIHLDKNTKFIRIFFEKDYHVFSVK